MVVTLVATSCASNPASSRCTSVTYTAPASAAPQQAQLCVPNQSQPVAVVLVHGGGETGGTRTDTDPWAARYQQSGVVTLAIDYTLFESDSDAGRWPVPERQVKAAVQYLRQADIGVSTVVVHGWSAGARLAAIAWTTPDDPVFDGPELWIGISDRVDGAILFYGYYDGFVFSGDDYFDGPAPAAAVPLGRAASASGPGMLVHGSGDFLVPDMQSIQFADALAAAQIPHDLLVLPGDGGHNIDGYGEARLSPDGDILARRAVALVLSLG